MRASSFVHIIFAVKARARRIEKGKLKSSSEYLRAFDLKLYMAHEKNSFYGDKKINFKRAVLHGITPFQLG
jgi:hypothetical protein